MVPNKNNNRAVLAQVLSSMATMLFEAHTERRWAKVLNVARRLERWSRELKDARTT